MTGGVIIPEGGTNEVITSKENDEKINITTTPTEVAVSGSTATATVTKEKRLRLFWQGDKIVDISREFLNSNGGRRETDILIKKNECKNIFDS